MSKQRSVNLNLRSPTGPFESDMKRNAKNFQKATQQMQRAAKKTGNSFKKIDQNAGLAGAGVMSLGGILSDMPFGLRGVANNIQQLGAVMGMLVGKTGSLKGAFKSLAGQLMGPLGIMVAFQGAISLLQMFQEKQRKAKKAAEEASGGFSGQAQNLRALNAIYQDGNESLETREKAFKKLKKELPALAKLEFGEASAIETVNKAIEDNIKLEIARAKAKLLAPKLAELELELANKRSQLVVDEVALTKAKESQRIQQLTANSAGEAVTLSQTAAKEELDLRNTKKSIAKLSAEQLSLEAQLIDAKRIDLGLTTETAKQSKKALTDYEKALKAMEKGGGGLMSGKGLAKGIGGIGEQMENSLGLMPDMIRTLEVPFVEVADKVESRWVSMFNKFKVGLSDMAQAASMAFSIFSQLSSNRMSELEQEYELRKRQIEDTVKGEESKAYYLEGLNKEFEEKKRAEQRKTAQREKAQAIFNSTINGIQAFTKALASTANPIFAGIIGGLAGAQVAAIASTPIPALAQGGLAYAPTLAMVGDNKGASADPEVIAPLSKLTQMLGGGNVTVTGRIQGEVIHLQQERVSRRKSRTR